MLIFRNSGYSHHGASRSKSSLISWNSTSYSAHEDISENLSLLRERSRDLYSGGGPIGRGAIDRVVLNSIGSGLRLNVRINGSKVGMTPEESSEWASNIESVFDAWASRKRASIDGTLNFYELQVLAFKSVLLDGDCFIVFGLNDGHNRRDNLFTRLQVGLIEGERVADPTVKPSGVIIDEGVELDEMGRPVAYYIANRNPESTLINQPILEFKRVPIYDEVTGERNILHLFNPERIGQRRGVPFLAPVIETLKQLSRYTDAELMAAVVSGMYSVFFEHPERESGQVGEESYASEEGLGGLEGLENITQQEMYGTVIDLPEGVKVSTASPGRPNQNFNAFIASLVQQIGGALGIPSELLFLHFTASYSASRGALLEAWKLFRYWREWFASNFCQPVYEKFLYDYLLAVQDEQFTKSDYRDEDYFYWAAWTGPSQGQLDPVKEVNAAIQRVNNGFSTYQKETGELTGEDFEMNIAQLKREKELLRGIQDKKAGS